MNYKSKIIGLSLGLALILALFILPGLTPENYSYFLSRRIPIVLAITLTGGAVALSSVLFQTITANRILTPAALGLDSLFLLTQAVIVFTFGSTSFLATDSNANFAVTSLVMIGLSMVLFRIFLKHENANILQLILVGMVFGQLFRSLASFLIMVIDPNEFVALQNKMFASFNSINTGILILSSCILLVATLYISRHQHIYDAISLGRETAIGVGVQYDQVLHRTFVLTAVMVSVATALVGPILFLGLLVANLARQLAGTYKHSVILPISVLLSSVFLLGGQLFVDRVLNFGTTVSVIINLIGGIYFIFLLVRESKL